MTCLSEKVGYPGYQQADPLLYPPVPSAPPPPYTAWEPCGAYTAILEESSRFFGTQINEEWTFLKNEKFLTVHTRKADKYRVRGLRISGEFASKTKPGFGKGSTMENMKSQLFGIESLRDLPNIDSKSIRLIEQPTLNTTVYTYVEKYCWPMSNREYLMLEQMKLDPATGKIVILGTPVSLPGVPAKDKPIRAFQEYLYILETSKVNPNNVIGTFYMFFDARGNLTPADQEGCGFKEITKLFLDLPKYI